MSYSNPTILQSQPNFHIYRHIDSQPSKSTQSLIHKQQGYYGAATGKGRQAAKAELEKLDLSSNTLSLQDGVKEAARIIYVAHQDSKDKEFELEITWISGHDGPTKGRHVDVPSDLKAEAERLAKKALEGDDDEDDDDEEESSDDDDDDAGGDGKGGKKAAAEGDKMEL